MSLTKEEREIELKKLNSMYKIKEEQIKLLQTEQTELNTKINELLWVKISWADLEAWLRKNCSDPSDYCNNPIVKSEWDIKYNRPSTYCLIRKSDDKLQIGAFEYTDGFPHDKDVYVRYDFKQWRPSRF